ncbi:MAG: hypothetical protein ACR2OA_20770 [Rubripirellula sp.]
MELTPPMRSSPVLSHHAQCCVRTDRFTASCTDLTAEWLVGSKTLGSKTLGSKTLGSKTLGDRLTNVRTKSSDPFSENNGCSRNQT